MELCKKRILVTGGGGFLGRHVIARLRAIGCQQVLSPRRLQFDLTREVEIHRLVNAYRPHVVIHLAAAVGGIGRHLKCAGEFVYQNVVMGCQLIEACRRVRAEKFLTAGTICAYPKVTPVPFNEDDLWNGYPAEVTAPYGLAKKILIVQSEAYYQQYGFKAINLLLANLYGPGDHFDTENGHVIPSLIRRFVEAAQHGSETVTVWGSGTATREFLYAEDAAVAISRAAEHLETPAPINIGTGKETTIADLARMIAVKTDFRGSIRFDASRPDGQPRRCLDISRAKRLLSFQATTSLSEGLNRTIAWYRSSLPTAAQVQDGKTRPPVERVRKCA